MQEFFAEEDILRVTQAGSGVNPIRNSSGALTPPELFKM